MPDTLIEIVTPLLIKHEGKRLKVYADTLGIKTIGVGFNLEQAGAQSVVERVGANYQALLNGTQDLTDEQCNQILSQCIISAVEWLSKVFVDFTSYSIPRQAALVDMAFMGEGSFSKFHNMIAAVRFQDWEEVASQALASKWATQVGIRAHDDAAIFVHG